MNALHRFAALLLAACMFASNVLAQAAPPVTQAQGERIISRLVAEISKYYPAQRQTQLIKLFFYRSDSGEIVLMRSTDLFIGKEHGGPGIIELTENALAADMRFAGTDDPLASLANFPGHPKYRNTLTALLDSSNAGVRAGALLALTRVPHQSLVGPIARRLRDEHLDVRLAAVLALGSSRENVLNTFVLENPGAAERALRSSAGNQAIALSHPYRTNTVNALLVEYLNGPVRPSDMPAILNTLVTLEMREPIRSKVKIHSQDSGVEAFLQQCYRKLETLP